MRSLRTRITALATVVLVVVLAVASVVIVQLVRQQLRNDLQQQNQATMQVIRDRIEQGEDPFRLRLPAGTDGTEFLIETLEGGYVNSTALTLAELEELGVEGVNLPPVDDVAIFGDSVIEVAFDAEDFTTESIIATAPNQTAYRIVALSTSVLIDRNVDQVRSVLLVVIPLLALLFAGLAWLLTGRVLAPVHEMTRKARSIRADTLHERLDEPGTNDEIDRLAITLNSMLDRLDHGARLQHQFVSDASHELRSPLTVMLGEAELASSSTDPARLAEANELVRVQGARMSRLIDDLLHLARTGETALHSVDVDLDDVLRTLANERPGSIDTTAVEPARVTGDSGGLTRLFRNLLDNATRHATAQILVTCAVDRELARITVEDDGPGIPEPDRERVFERFARLDEARTTTDGGTGLGLAIAKAIVASHSGSIAVTDSALGGACFTVTLPTNS